MKITIIMIIRTRCERISWVVVIFVAIGVTPILLTTMVVIVVTSISGAISVVIVVAVVDIFIVVVR